jgi:tryptophan 7-halogenase
MTGVNMQQRKKVVVAGGGTAGWIAATALSRQLGPLIDITLVESDEIGTVGVGEATIPTARTFHRLMDIDEQDFMRSTNASFKLGISFENWGEIGDRYIHSFGQVGKGIWMGDFHHFWYQAKAYGSTCSLDDYCLELQAAEAGRFHQNEQKPLSYAYHLDATAYARYLRAICETRGVRRVEGKITRVDQHAETGDITQLLLDNGTEVEGDLFIDCTGFRGLLIEETLKTGYEDWSEWLPTNSAFAVQTESVRPAVPYTRAVAHHAGWRWQIPLQHRVGNGLVFCNEYMSDDEARDFLLSQVDGKPVTEPRKISYVTGTRRKSWNKNVVALGLSSGFVEPLESTSIHLIMVAITRLLQMFPFSDDVDGLRDRFNKMSRVEIEKIRDFIILHYHQTERTDSPFWNRCRTMTVPDALKSRIELFRENAHAYQDGDDLFRIDSWVQVLLGQRLQPKAYHHLAQLMPREHLEQALSDLKTGIDRAVANMPSHHEFLQRYCGSAEPVTSPSPSHNPQMREAVQA